MCGKNEGRGREMQNRLAFSSILLYNEDGLFYFQCWNYVNLPKNSAEYGCCKRGVYAIFTTGDNFDICGSLRSAVLDSLQYIFAGYG